MVEVLVFSLLSLVGVGLFLIGFLGVYFPRGISMLGRGSTWWPERLRGPQVEGRPIEVIAEDLRVALTRRENALESQSSWYVTHDLRVAERELHDVVEEAARALGLGACPAGMTWTSAHLGVRLRDVEREGIVLPRYAEFDALHQDGL